MNKLKIGLIGVAKIKVDIVKCGYHERSDICKCGEIQ